MRDLKSKVCATLSEETWDGDIFKKLGDGLIQWVKSAISMLHRWQLEGICLEQI